MRRCIFAALAAMWLSAGVDATTVVAPTFETLVAQADAIVESEVIDTTSRIAPQRDGAPIVTDVNFGLRKCSKAGRPRRWFSSSTADRSAISASCSWQREPDPSCRQRRSSE